MRYPDQHVCGVIQKLFTTLKSNGSGKNLPPLTFTRLELINWVFGQEKYLPMYLSWEASDFDKWLRPSLDRLDTSLGYSFNNLELVTWRENHTREALRHCKPVTLTNLRGEIVEKFLSKKEAAEVWDISHSSLGESIRNKRLFRGFAYWSYDE